MDGLAPPGGGGMLGGPPGGANPELAKQCKTWLIISAVSAVVCCNGCFGIIAAVLCYLAMQAADQGNVADAEAKLKWGKIIAIVGIALGALGAIGYAAQMVLYAAAS